MNHNTMVAPTIWGLLVNCLADTYYYEPDTLNEFYVKADTAHQHAILDMIAYAQVRSPMNAINSTEQHWGDMCADDDSTVPKNLSLTMDAIDRLSHLNVTEQQRKHFDTPEQLEAVSAEVREHQHWVRTNPYYYETNKPTTTSPQPFTLKTYNLISTLSLVLLCPAKYMYAALKLLGSPYTSLDHVKHPMVYEDYVHQCAISRVPIAHGSHMTIAALTNCPEQILTKILYGESLTRGEYSRWGETMEALFPARQYAYNMVAHQQGYELVPQWSTFMVLEVITDVFEETTEMWGIGDKTTQWVLDDHRNSTPYENMVLTKEHIF